MIFKDCYPGLLLQNIVQVYRLRHFIIPEELTIAPKPYPARPEHCIVFYIRGFERTEIPSSQLVSQKPKSVVTGQYTQRINRYSGSSEFLMVQVVLMPGVLHRITGIPLHEIRDTYIDLEDIFPKETKQVNEQLQHCTEYNEMIGTIEKYLLQLHSKAKLEVRAADLVFKLMLTQPVSYTLDWLAREACLSPRQFERKTYDYIGICPRTFHRISRFVQSFDMRLKNGTLDWLSIAMATGYHDYQHMVKDYKEFAGTKPNDLVSAESKTLERRLGLHA